MGPFNVPPDEDWWERTLLEHRKGRTHVGASVERVLATPGRADSEPGLIELASHREFEATDPEYAAIAAATAEFARGLSARIDMPPGYETLASTSLRVADHLAHGHALGTEDASVCGNIVYCRWALAEARFCEASLTQIVARLGRPEFAGLLDRCRALCHAIDERIDWLRQRVWW